MIRARYARIASAFIVVVLCGATAAHAGRSPFPEYDSIKPNVDFWTKVYTRYTTAQGIVHDSRDLSLVYDVIALLPYETPGATFVNRRRMKQAVTKYQGILKHLSRNKNTNDPEHMRVAALFGDQKGPDAFRKAAALVRCQVGQKDRFMAGLVRSGAYIDEIRAIFRSYDLPVDLAYLPHVESSFDTMAYSKYGAAGMWQFTRSTGKRFMRIDYVLDERRDPIISAHAAARLLKENHAKLGDWPLAITAYNHGASGMERAKKAHGNYPRIFKSYRSRIFKFASRNFYAEFLAARKVAADYKTYFGDLVPDRPGNTHKVHLQGFISLADVLAHYKIEPETVRQLNPALRPPIFSGQKFIPKDYVLHLPTDRAISGPIKPGAALQAYYKEEQRPSRFHTVQRGETAGKIARLHGVRLADLVLANNLGRHATIYPRQTLRIPLSDEPVDRPFTAKSDPEAQSLLTAALPRTDAHAQDPGRRAPLPETETAEPYPQPVLASVLPLAADNDPRSETDADPAAREGDRLNPEVVGADVHIERLVRIKGRTIGVIKVEVEETLGHYAEWANIPTTMIRQMNNLAFGATLRLDQEIKIPLTQTTQRRFEEQRYEYHKRLQEDFFTAYRVGDLKPYQVRPGDTYWSLCRDRFDIPMWLLKQCNPDVDLTALHRRQKLMVPSVEKKSAQGGDTGADGGLEEQTPPHEREERPM